MNIFSKLQSLFISKNVEKSNSVNETEPVSRQLDESERPFIDDVHNFHHHDFSSLTEFENETMLASEYMARMNRLDQIYKEIPYECYLAMRHCWGDDVLESSKQFPFESCMAALTQCSATFMVNHVKTSTAIEYDRDVFAVIWGNLSLSLLSFKVIAPLCVYLRKGEPLPPIEFQLDVKKEDEITYNCGGFSSGAKLAEGYIEKELAVRESMKLDIQEMKDSPDYALGMTLARIYDLLEDAFNKEMTNQKVLLNQQEYDFAKHHLFRAMYALKRLCSTFGIE